VSSIEHLKEEARRFEQDEQWGKALDLYSQAIDQLSADDTPDIALFNRSGDLATKVGHAAQAVAFYERAVDFYMDAGLPNNAVAVCKKVMRNLPDRYSIHLKMGQIRAAQGFITDARSSFVTYAERVQAAGDLHEAFRALIEFVKLAPDDYEMCMMLAGQLERNDRADEALTQYVGAYRIMQRKGLSALAEAAATKIRNLDPDLDVEQAAADPSFSRGVGFGDEETVGGEEQSADGGVEVEIVGPVDLPLMSFDDDEEDEDEDAKAAEEAAAKVAAEAAEEAAAKAAEEAAAKAAEEAAAKAAEEAAAKAAEEDADADAAKAAQEEAAEAAEEAAAKAAGATAAEEAAAEAARKEKAADAAAARAAEEEAASKAVEQAAQARAATEAAEGRAAEEAAAKAAAEQSLSVSNGDPESKAPAESPPGGYVDLGAVLLGEDVQTGKKSTRFVVPYEEPTGDDQADFDRMLAQFREKVSENIDADDVMAHYDLGTAYMEMGLLDEAISEFQVVLRGTSDHLATYEMLGQTFLQKEEPKAALRSLTRGLDAPCEVEEERVGIYYYLGLANERIGDKDTALEFYDRVFALDINFADVTERLRALRS
jgi:tetratricopeptide (TPR) repeat protein